MAAATAAAVPTAAQQQQRKAAGLAAKFNRVYLAIIGECKGCLMKVLRPHL